MSAAFTNLPIPGSILDTDLYKLTMQQAVLYHFPHVQATYRFTNRDKTALFTRQSIERFRTTLSYFTDLALTEAEQEWLKETCTYLTPDYLAFLAAYRYRPEQVRVVFVPVSSDGLLGNVEIEASGPWVETILWEVPLMACLSECYFQLVMTDWSYDNQEEIAFGKAKSLIEGGAVFSEFGTRRRRSYHAQDIVINSLLRAKNDLPHGGSLAGTSNVHFAHKYSIPPIGTIAHEWFMGVAALKGYEKANSIALELWEQVYPDNVALTALTDTFSTGVFFKSFMDDPERAQRWDGLRQDSGDPFVFGPRVLEMYQTLGIDHTAKTLIYSDALNVEKALKIKQQCDDLGFKKVSFGIGTFLTNDFRTISSGGTEKSKALNIVVKLSSVDSKPCVKLSDDLNKNTGDPATVKHVKEVFNLPI